MSNNEIVLAALSLYSDDVIEEEFLLQRMKRQPQYFHIGNTHDSCFLI